jgi:thiamine biosynthesis lipoprotein
MGGPARLIINGTPEKKLEVDTAARQVRTLLEELEARYSRYRPDSIVSVINKRAGSGMFTKVDLETRALLDLAGQLWDASGGLFDITSGPLRRAWDFRADGAADPTQIESARQLVGWEKIEWRASSLHLPTPGMEIDLGGLAKEYAADSVISLMRRLNVASALIELAGDVATIGDSEDGTPWRVGIQNPDGVGSLCTVQLSNAAVATSGNYARRVDYEGKQYGHLLNPQTGWPVEGPSSVSVLDSHCLTAGAVATVACLHSEEKARRWLEYTALPWLLVSSTGKRSGPIGDRMATLT